MQGVHSKTKGIINSQQTEDHEQAISQHWYYNTYLNTAGLTLQYYAPINGNVIMNIVYVRINYYTFLVREL